MSPNPQITDTFSSELPELLAEDLESMKDEVETPPDPMQTAHGIYVTVHGHFYQPPRENPYLDAIERQPGAEPYHDWNERINHECYRPNAFARVYNDRGEVVDIVNNYEYLSFNIGPTLMSWLERYDPQVYQRILDADRLSAERLNGHGNAIAQVYNHIIMPLANKRDKYTQIRWGKADFRQRFGREPEGMWLAETAVDYSTLEVLHEEGIKFIVLAPSQAERCRLLPTKDHPKPEWNAVGGGQIDPTRPYRCFLPSREKVPEATSELESDVASATLRDRKYIDIFFYDGPISRDMGFNDVLKSSHHLAGRLSLAIHGDHRPSQLISVATDGETFGHHKRDAEKCLTYAFVAEFPRRGWTLTNFAHYLSICPPTWEVELKPVTAWSCSHGVDRWQDNCGCGGGGEWHQLWRRPLRNALNWLRDQLISIYQEEGGRLLLDPWQARDEYIQVIRDRSPENVAKFFLRQQKHSLTPSEQVDALRLLEMQRHALLMFTSCGWFFEELSRPEGTQILRYAARAIELAGDVAGIQLEKEFIQILSQAPSNVDFFKDGAGVYQHQVIPSQINLEKVAAHYAISGLFTTYATEQRIYCYTVYQRDYQLQRMGPLTLAVGQVQLASEITRESVELVFAVLHLGGWDFHCCIQPFSGRRAYTQMKEHLMGILQLGSAAQAILGMNQYFDGKSFSLHDLFAEERHRIMRLLSQETLLRLDQLYTQVYRDNYGVVMAFHRDELPVPRELQVAAEIALGNRCLTAAKALDAEIGDDPENVLNATGDSFLGLTHLVELETCATEAGHLRCNLDIPEVKQILEKLIVRSLSNLLYQANPETTEPQLERLERMIAVGKQLNLHLAKDQIQELYFYWLHGDIGDQCFYAPNLAQHGDRHGAEHGDDATNTSVCWTVSQFRRLLQLGNKLSVNVSTQLESL
jgi:alpha-amylase/alpha-mannosidase (GH57 family)